VDILDNPADGVYAVRMKAIVIDTNVFVSAMRGKDVPGSASRAVLRAALTGKHLPLSETPFGWIRRPAQSPGVDRQHHAYGTGGGFESSGSGRKRTAFVAPVADINACRLSEGVAMSTLTLRLPEDLAMRLKNIAEARGVSMNKFITEISVQALAAFDTETRFKAAAVQANIPAALAVLDRLDVNAETVASY